MNSNKQDEWRQLLSLVDTFYKNSSSNDEPQLHQYTAKIKDEWGSGISFNKESAKLKAIGEAIERYCLGVYNSKQLINASINNLQKQKRKYLDLHQVTSFSKKQRRKYHNFNFDNNSKFFWTNGKLLRDNSQILIPAQLIYVPYHSTKVEPIIRFPISTGAAFGTSKEDALLRGICEIVERDSFMLFFLNKITPEEYDLEKSKHFNTIHNYFKRYNLDLRVFDITTSTKVPSVMAVILDNSIIGPKMTTGLKTSLDSWHAITGAIEEAQHIRTWMRNEIQNSKKSELDKLHKNPEKIKTARERGLFWYHGKNLKKLDFWLKKRKRKPTPARQKIATQKSLKQLLGKLTKQEHEVYYVDITTKKVLNAKFHVLKVVIPKLHPLYLEEKYPYLGGKKLNKELLSVRLPHPFL